MERGELVLRGFRNRPSHPLAAPDDLGGRVDGVQRACSRHASVRRRPDAAEREGIFGKRLVAGAFVFSAGLGLVATNCINAFSYGYDKLRFIKPVFIGDTIYSIRTHLEKRPKYKEMGLIRASYQVFKAEGELVMYCEHLQTVKYRNASAFADVIEVRA